MLNTDDSRGTFAEAERTLFRDPVAAGKAGGSARASPGRRCGARRRARVPRRSGHRASGRRPRALGPRAAPRPPRCSSARPPSRRNGTVSSATVGAVATARAVATSNCSRYADVARRPLRPAPPQPPPSIPSAREGRSRNAAFFAVASISTSSTPVASAERDPGQSAARADVDQSRPLHSLAKSARRAGAETSAAGVLRARQVEPRFSASSSAP